MPTDPAPLLPIPLQAAPFVSSLIVSCLVEIDDAAAVVADIVAVAERLVFGESVLEHSLLPLRCIRSLPTKLRAVVGQVAVLGTAAEESLERLPNPFRPFAILVVESEIVSPAAAAQRTQESLTTTAEKVKLPSGS